MAPVKLELNPMVQEIRCYLKNFKIATIVSILDSQAKQVLQFWISILSQCLISSFSSINLKNFMIATILDIGTILTILLTFMPNI